MWVSFAVYATLLPLHAIGPGNCKVLLSFKEKENPHLLMEDYHAGVVKNSLWDWIYTGAAIFERLQSAYLSSTPITFLFKCCFFSNKIMFLYLDIISSFTQFIFLSFRYSPGFTSLRPILKPVKKFPHAP